MLCSFYNVNTCVSAACLLLLLFCVYYSFRCNYLATPGIGGVPEIWKSEDVLLIELRLKH